jgi:hypothetical protein
MESGQSCTTPAGANLYFNDALLEGVVARGWLTHPDFLD